MPRVDRRPRRRLNAEERRAAILDSAKIEFSTNAYQHVSVAAIGATAGASEALVLRYFSSKAELYVTVVMTAIESLLEAQRDADDALDPRATPQTRLATSVTVYLDFVATRPTGWAGPFHHPYGEPAEAALLRRQLRDRYVGLLRDTFSLEPAQPRDHALYGYLGFLDAACLSWVERGCPDPDRPAITAMVIAALDGALAAT